MNLTLILMGILIIAYISRRMRKKSPYNDFDLAGMNEKFQMAEDTRNALNAMEQLLTELQTVNPERQLVIHLEWLADEEQTNSYELFCDGYDTATEHMRLIAEYEINALRHELSYECAALSYATRGRGFGKNRITRELQGKIQSFVMDVKGEW